MITWHPGLALSEDVLLLVLGDTYFPALSWSCLGYGLRPREAFVARLSERDLVCAEVLVGKGKSVRSIATDLGVDESMLRYRLKRRADRAIDGRGNQPESCSAFEPIIMAWIARQDFTGETGRPESMKSLYEVLVAEHGY